VSRANGLAEVLEDGKTGLLVAPRSPEVMAEAIKRLMGDSVLANSLASQGQRLMRERYSWRTYAETMLGLFQESIDKHQYRNILGGGSSSLPLPGDGQGS
jgi:glycosyltransferase involved in cell wall biosynthesis